MDENQKIFNVEQQMTEEELEAKTRNIEQCQNEIDQFCMNVSAEISRRPNMLLDGEVLTSNKKTPVWNSGTLTMSCRIQFNNQKKKK